MRTNEIKYLVGNENYKLNVLPVYSDIVCDFLDDLSKLLRKDKQAKEYSDIMAFAFWCRKSNINQLKEKYNPCDIRIGRGLVFHIAPSNVPVNFAYSLMFGMLSGNGNIVRVSNKDFLQTTIICKAIEKVLHRTEYALLEKQTQVISYAHSKNINDIYSMKCDMRVIWGGDDTIQEIRKSPISMRSNDITFADRFSFAIFNEETMENLSQEELGRLVERFYNDTYLMDQNACSSPHLILWKNSEYRNGRKRFWNAVEAILQKYDFSEKKAMDKFTMLCENIIRFPEIKKVEKYTNLLYVVNLSNIPNNMEELRGKFGLFYEIDIKNLEEVCTYISAKTQTCVTYGMDNKYLLQEFLNYHTCGVDRIVEVGKAMDISPNWDGYDIISSLSRGINVNNSLYQ